MTGAARKRSAYEDERFARAFASWVERMHPEWYEGLWEEWLPCQPARVLDLGCGSGNLALHLAQRAERVVALDLSESMLGIIGLRRRERGVENLSLVRGDLTCLPFAAGSFDLVVADSSLHDADLAILLPGLREVLSPGGRIIARDQITRNPARDASPLFHFLGACRRFPGHVARYGPVSALVMARFEMRPSWLRYRASVPWLTPDGFRAVFQEHLPGCEIHEEGWSMTAFWIAPTA